MTTPDPKEKHPLDILLVEDNPADVRMTQEAFKEAEWANRLHVARDGVDALAFLRREGRFAGSKRPDLILLDLNLPKLPGHDFLSVIKADPALAEIPVVVLTTSQMGSDVYRAKDLGADCYVTKPDGPDEFVRVVRYIRDFWSSLGRGGDA